MVGALHEPGDGAVTSVGAELLVDGAVSLFHRAFIVVGSTIARPDDTEKLP